MALTPTAITTSLEDALMKMTTMVVLGSKASILERWILVLGLAIIMLGVFLLTLRFALFSLILIIIGVALSIYWLFGVIRSGERQRQFPEDDLIFSKPRTVGKMNCACSICKQAESKTCIEIRCACCVLMRNKQIISHFNKLHQ